MASHGDRSFRQMIKAAVVKIKILSTLNEMGLQLHLKKAVESNDLVATKDTISRGAWVNARSPAGSTYLMEASRLGHISIVKFLIKSHAAVNAVNFQNNTALHYAYQKQQYEVIQYLESHGAAPSHKILNSAGLTPRKFMYAKLPLDRKLKVACQHGDLQNAEFFALQGADVNFKTLAGSTPLMDAVWYGHSHVVDFLLRSGADIEHKTKAGNTALHMAYQKFHLPVINILERQGANKLALNKKGLTPAKMLYLKGKLNHKLRLACQFGDVSGAALFIEKGADINSASKKTGATPLMDACWAGNKEIVNLLMVCGADISLKNNRKNTALHLAIQRGFSELIPILMKGVHADKATKVKNYIGLRPEDLGKVVAATASKDEGMYSDDLSKACATGNTYLVKDLCRSSAIDINAQSESGTTVLMDAVYQGHADVVEVLLRARANPNAKTFRGQTVLHFAYERNDTKIIQMLERAKAKPVKNLAGQMPQDLRPSADGFDVKRRSSKATFRFESSKSKVTISNPLHDQKKHTKHHHHSKRQSPGKLAALTPLESKKGGIAAADIESKIGLAMVQTDASLVALSTAKPTVAVSAEEADKRKEQALKAYLNPESEAAPVAAATPADVFGKRSVLGKLDPLAQKAAQEKAAEENRKAVEAAAERKRRADEERQAKLEAERQALLAAEEEKRRQRQAKQLERERRRKAQKHRRHSPAGDNDDDVAAKAAAEEAAKAAAKAAEAARLAAEKAEQERKAREEAQAARLAKEKEEADQRAAEEAEKERVAKEKAEAEKKAAEEAEQERLAKEKALAEQIAKDKAEAERLAVARVEADRLEAEKVAAAAEAARLAEEKAEEERLAAEAEKAAAEKAEAERLAAEKAAADAAEAARLAAAKAEAERIAAIKDAAERAAAEKAEAERKAAEEAEAQRKVEEERVRAEEARLAKEKVMAERLARMKAAASAAAAAKHAAEQAEAARAATEKKAEEERLAAEKALAEKIAAAKAEEERLAAERAAAAAARERQEAEERKRKEAEDQARKKAEEERLTAERKAEEERIAAEKAAAEAAEAARLAAEKAAAAAEAARVAAERKIHEQREEVAKAETARIMEEAAQEAERVARERREAKKKKQEAARKAAEEEAKRVAAAAQAERRRKAEEKAKAAAAEASAKRESKLGDSSDGGGTSTAAAEPLSVAEAYDSKIQDWKLEEANTLLLEAVMARELADVETFVEEEGADVNTVDAEGYSPLLIASYYGAHDIVGYLLEHNSNIFFQDGEGASALAAAAQSGHIQCVRRLLQHSHDTLDLCVSNGSSPLFLAAQEGHVGVVSTLLQADADLELVREDECTALAIAAQENHVEIVRLLLDAKADPTHKTTDGHTPQYLTSSQEIFKLLKAVLPDDVRSKSDAPAGGVSDNEFALWLWGKAVEHNANLVCETVVEFLDKLAPGQGEALDEALDEYDVDVPATLDSFMHLFSVIDWTESAVDTLRHWTQQEDCGTIFFYNTLTHVSTYDNPFQVTASPWEKIVDDGGVYYYNNVTQESQWEKPEGFIDTSESAADAASGGESVAAVKDSEHDPRDDWEEVHDYDAHYFYNRVTGETAWKLPDFDKLDAAADSGGSSTSGASSPSKKAKKAKKDKKSKKNMKGLAKHGSNGGGNGDGSEVDMRYTLNPNDNEQGKNDTSNFVYRIDPADHWEQHEEFDSKFYQNRITGESHSDTDDGGVIPQDWEAHNEMDKQFFANATIGEEWELQFSASDGKCRFVETSSGREQEYPPWIRSDAEAAAVLRDEPWRVLWLKIAHREHQQARGD